MSAYRRDKWRQYAGDEPEPGSSEDEAYAAVDAKVAYTRQSVQERAEKWDAIEAFEASKIMPRIFPEELIRNMLLTKRQELHYMAELEPHEQVEIYLDTV